MDRQRVDRRRKPQRSVLRSVWVPAFVAILVLYVLFVVRVQYYASSSATTANSIGAATDTNAIHNERPLEKERAATEDKAPSPALAHKTAAPGSSAPQKVTAEPEIHVGVITKKPMPISIEPVATAVGTPASVQMQVTTESPAPVQTPQNLEAAAPVEPKNEASIPSSTASIVDDDAKMPMDHPIFATTATTIIPLVSTPSQIPATAPVVDDDAKMPMDHPIFATTATTPTHVVSTTSQIPTTAPVAMPTAPPSASPTTTTTAPTPSTAVVVDQHAALGDRHEMLSGYDQTVDYLSTYRAAPGESLFLFFTCSDRHFNAGDWSQECVDARETIHRVFAKSPPGNRLVTIYAGSEKLWSFQNKFRNDRDLRIKTVPCLMKWHGNGGETSGMMITDALTEEPFLRYLFQNQDEPDKFLNAAAMVDTKTIETVSSYEDYQAKLAAYKLEAKPRAPLYLMFVSGRLAENNRPWCPYCRFSELPLEYGFYAFAPPNARLLRVEVAQTYQQWKTPNSYNRDQALGPLRGVPGFFTVRQLASQELQMDRIYERFDQLVTLRSLFQTAALAKDE